MVIEWLKFRVAPEFREPFIQIDTDIWTSALENYPGFLGKMVWISPIDLTELILVIHWATREDWQAVPQTDINQIDQQFDQAIEFDYELVESDPNNANANYKVDIPLTLMFPFAFQVLCSPNYSGSQLYRLHLNTLSPTSRLHEICSTQLRIAINRVAPSEHWILLS